MTSDVTRAPPLGREAYTWLMSAWPLLIAWAFGASAPAAACDFEGALREGKADTAAFERLLARGCNVDTVGADGETPLERAFNDRPIDARGANWLLAHGAVANRRYDPEGTTILHWLARGDDPNGAELVEALVRAGADVDAVDPVGQTPLFTAMHSLQRCDSPTCSCFTLHQRGCWIGNKPIARALLAHGADPNRPDREGSTPLFTAVDANSFEDVSMLLAAGSRPTGQDGSGHTILTRMISPTERAGGDPDPRIARILLAHGADPNERDRGGDLPLPELAFWCVSPEPGPGADRDRLGIARLLLSKGARVDAVDDEGKTALYEAAYCNFGAMARLLVSAGASAAAPDRDGRTALDMAAWNSAPDLVAALLDRGASAQATDQAGLTPLHWLARGGHRGTVEEWRRTAQVLIARGGSISAKDKDGRTPLAHAAQHPALFMELVGQGARPDGVTARGGSLLHLATYWDYDDVVATWMPRFAEARDADGRTPLHWAAFFGSAKALGRLLEHGVDVNAVDSGGRTALDWAATACHQEVASTLVRWGAHASKVDWPHRLGACPVRPQLAPIDERLHRAAAAGGHPWGKEPTDISELLDKGFAIDGRDAEGRTPLHRAATFIHFTTALELLLKRGAPVDARDREGRTPLQIATEAGNLKGMSVLLAAAADVNAADDRGRTPLHWAAPSTPYWNRDLVLGYQLLLDKGARVDPRDTMGRTPLHALVAATDRASGASELLVCRGADPNARDAFGWTPSDIARVRAWEDPTIAARPPSCSGRRP
jgi:ankyrin repeat protein